MTSPMDPLCNIADKIAELGKTIGLEMRGLPAVILDVENREQHMLQVVFVIRDEQAEEALAVDQQFAALVGGGLEDEIVALAHETEQEQIDDEVRARADKLHERAEERRRRRLADEED